MPDYQIDSLDREILRRLQADSRTPFLEIARDLTVSGGTVHARVGRMRELGIIRGSRVVLDYERLGFGVTAFAGLKLSRASACSAVQERLAGLEEVVEVHYTTGTYSLLIKVVVPGMSELYELLSERLQALEDVQSTETFVVLNTALSREIALDALEVGP